MASEYIRPPSAPAVPADIIISAKRLFVNDYCIGFGAAVDIERIRMIVF
jgi:hypothetical protein